MWPLSFWLPTAYSAAAPPVAAMFSIMSKLGLYVVLRLWLLLFGADSGASAHFGGEWLKILRHGNHCIRHDRRTGVSRYRPARRLLRTDIVWNRHGCHRHGAGRRDRSGAILSSEFDTRHRRTFYADGTA